MKILLSNDDGVHAEGLRAMADCLRDIATIKIVAPDRNRSGASNSLTLDRPLRARTISDGVLSIEGTPTDCVHLAITGLLERRPNMVISGINEGANLGDDVLYSGTVAAAIEGRRQGLPALAVSLAIDERSVNHGSRIFHYAAAAEITKRIIKRLLRDSLPATTILNINVPNLPLEAIQGFEVTRLGTRHQAEHTIAQLDPRGHTVYWVGPVGPEEDAGPGTDFYAVKSHKVSITPMQVDFTHYQAFDQLADWVKGLV